MRTIEITGGATPTISIDGVIDIASIPDLHDALTKSISLHPATVVVVDLDKVVGIDDCALGVLLGAAATARDSGGDVELLCNSVHLRNRLTRTRLDRAITIRTSGDES